MQTSTVTVAVLSVPNHTELKLDERDLEYKVCRSGGPGGQAVNKVNSAVQLTHLPTGLMVRAEGERSQLQNRETALSILRAKLQEQKTSAASKERNDTRKNQVGSGMRGNKAFTYRWQDGIVTCHANDKKANLDKVLKGFLEDLA